MSSKRVLLINPIWKKSQSTIWSKVASVYPPLGLLNIAGVLKREGHIVDFLDMSAENMDPDEMVLRGRYDVVGVTMTTPLCKPALNVANRVKSFSPDTTIVVGGVHATIFHEDLAREDCVDFVVREEGEKTMLEICSDKPPEFILGLTYERNGTIHVNESRPQLDDLDWLSNIPYELLKMHLYRPPVGGYKRLPAFIMITGRNCPNNCSYCQHYHNKVRVRSAKKIYEEMVLLHERYGVKEINFYDDTFTIRKNNVHDLCDLLIDNRLDISWSCFSRVNTIDNDLIRKMKAAGCHLMLFGVESSNKEILRRMNKNIGLDDVKKAIDICRKQGIQTRCSYILGYPGETAQTMEETFQFSKLVDSDYVQYNAITAYPGTQLWKEAKEEGWLLESNEWDMSNCNIETPKLSIREVMNFYHSAHRRYYLRPKIIKRRLLGLRSVEGIKQELRGLRAVLDI